MFDVSQDQHQLGEVPPKERKRGDILLSPFFICVFRVATRKAEFGVTVCTPARIFSCCFLYKRKHVSTCPWILLGHRILAVSSAELEYQARVFMGIVDRYLFTFYDSWQASDVCSTALALNHFASGIRVTSP